MQLPLLSLDELVITQTAAYWNEKFSITDIEGIQVGAIEQNSGFKDFFDESRSVTVSATDPSGTPTHPVLIIRDPVNFAYDTFEVHLAEDNTLLAKLTKRFTMLKTNISVEMEGFSNVEITGDYFDFDFSITSDGRELAWITTDRNNLGRWLMGKNTYRVSLLPDLDQRQHAMIVGSVMALDMMRAKKKKS